MICFVGLSCVDIVSYMPSYPEEDADLSSNFGDVCCTILNLRCAEIKMEHGGNASNSATILASLGAEVEYFGILADDALLRFQQEDMSSLGIKYGNCPVIQCVGPLSMVVCSKKTGSRTICHAKGELPELKLEDFTKLNLDAYSWIHFEGRNEQELPGMMKHVKNYNDVNRKSIQTPHDSLKYQKALLPMSLEIELHIENLEIMLPLADVVIVGKDFAKQHNAKNSTEAAQTILGKVEPGTVVVCPWGEEEASYFIAESDPQNVKIHLQSPYVPNEIVDSLGAGDTFIAIVVYCLKKGIDVGTTVDYACKIASKKLEMRGMKGMKNILRELLPAP